MLVKTMIILSRWRGFFGVSDALATYVGSLVLLTLFRGYYDRPRAAPPRPGVTDTQDFGW